MNRVGKGGQDARPRRQVFAIRFGRDLWGGLRIALEPGKELRLTVTPVP